MTVREGHDLRLARVCYAIAERVVAGGIQNDSLEFMLAHGHREQIQVDALPRHVRNLECAHVERLERLQDLVTARTLDRNDVARRGHGPDTQIQRFRHTRRHNHVVGHTGRPLAENETGDLPAQPEIAAAILVADRLYRQCLSPPGPVLRDRGAVS